MTKIEMKLSVTDIDKVKTLVELLAKYQDDLPKDLVDSLHELADCDAFEIGRDYIVTRGFRMPVENSLGIKRLVSVNPILKRVRAIGEPDLYPDSFKLYGQGKVICEW